jgi:hypothetical protein
MLFESCLRVDKVIEDYTTTPGIFLVSNFSFPWYIIMYSFGILIVVVFIAPCKLVETSIHAYYKTSPLFVAIEEIEAIFKSLLQDLIVENVN